MNMSKDPQVSRDILLSRRDRDYLFIQVRFDPLMTIKITLTLHLNNELIFSKFLTIQTFSVFFPF
jgi:hypothetical protein